MSFLADLPSFGAFSKYTGGPSQHGCVPRYVCDHNTDPPDGQYIKTDETNILIRSLSKKKKVPPVQKPQEKPPDPASGSKRDVKGKRPADEESGGARLTSNMLDDFSAKRLKTAMQESTTTTTRRESESDSLENMTKTQLVALCKSSGLATNGNKEQLIERLKSAGVRRQ